MTGAMWAVVGAVCLIFLACRWLTRIEVTAEEKRRIARTRREWTR